MSKRTSARLKISAPRAVRSQSARVIRNVVLQVNGNRLTQTTSLAPIVQPNVHDPMDVDDDGGEVIILGDDEDGTLPASSTTEQEADEEEADEEEADKKGPKEPKEPPVSVFQHHFIRYLTDWYSFQWRPVKDWLPRRKEYLDELLRLDSRSQPVCQLDTCACSPQGVPHRCFVCIRCKLRHGDLKCSDCFGEQLYCSQCILETHGRLPLHRILVSHGPILILYVFCLITL